VIVHLRGIGTKVVARRLNDRDELQALEGDEEVNTFDRRVERNLFGSALEPYVSGADRPEDSDGLGHTWTKTEVDIVRRNVQRRIYQSTPAPCTIAFHLCRSPPAPVSAPTKSLP
jgi:hypothetical protein